MLRILFALLTLAVPAAAFADAFKDAAGDYRVQPSSVIHFSVAQLGGQPVEGTFEEFKGSFHLDASGLASSRVNISIDAGSVKAVDPRIEEFIKSPAVFDVANFPTVRFVSTKITRTGEKTANVEGRLSAKGRTRSSQFAVALQAQSGSTLTFHVTGKLSRTIFGMDVGTPIYSNYVLLDMTLVARRQ